MSRLLLSLCVSIFIGNSIAIAAEGIAMYGTPKYVGDFPHFSYANPDVPQGGHLRLSAIGGFDSLNPFIVRGRPAKGLGLVYQSLLNRSADEPFSLYSGLASIVDISDDRRRFHLRIHKMARFSDGSPVTSKDVRFSLEKLRDHGRPNHRFYYKEVERLETPSDRDLIFYFKETAGREMPLILGLMPVISSRFYSKTPFQETHLKPPLGSGPYKITSVQPGNQISFERIRPYWGDDLPAMKGRHNFDRVTYKYFRDKEVTFQAFRAKELDLYTEDDPAKWKSRKDTAAYKSATLERRLPPQMNALVFNTRRAPFDTISVRSAISDLFDFHWINKNILHGLYQRTGSFFEHTPLSALNPMTDTERTLLNSLGFQKGDLQIPELKIYKSNSDRRKAFRATKQALLKAGWKVGADGLLQNSESEPFQFEILIVDTRHQKILASFLDNLQKLGIKASLRLMDSAGYQERINNFDFDMMIARWGQSLSPGNEQAFYWSSQAANSNGSRNYPGIQMPEVDHVVELIKTATTQSELRTATRVLDRLLLSGQYVIPLYHRNAVWAYHHASITFPKILPDRGLSTDLWYMQTIDE